MKNSLQRGAGLRRRFASFRLLFLVLGLLGATSAGAETLKRDTLDFKGESRSYRVFVPPGAGPDKAPRPLVFVLHGWTDDGGSFSGTTGYHKLAARERFVVAYPDGKGTAWGVIDGLYVGGRDDVGFFRALRDRIDTRFAKVDRARVFSTGFSMGGMMSLRLACEAPDLVAGVAAIGGNLPSAIEASCKPDPRVSVLLIHGTLDPISPYEGGLLRAPGLPPFPMLSFNESARLFARLLGCKPKPVSGPAPPPAGGSSRNAEHYPGCKNGRVEARALTAWGHLWPNPKGGLIGALAAPVDATSVSWSFFKAARGLDAN